MNKNLTIHGLRGLAAILVVFYHIYGMAYIGGFFRERTVEGAFRIYHNFGPMGVNIFFMISGFLIIGSLSRHVEIKKFMINRIIRIYPVFLCLHLVVFLFGPFINYEWLGNVNLREYILGFISNIFLLPGMFDLPIAQKNAWSLSYEFTFYIVSSMFFFVIFKAKNNILRVSGIIILSFISLTIIYNHHTAVFFALGALVYYSYNHINFRYVYKRYYALNGVILLTLTFLLYDSNNNLAILPLIFSTLLFWVAVNEEGLLSNILRNKVFQYLGTISYSLYLIHPFAMFPLKVIFSSGKMKNLINNEYLSIILFGIASLILAIIAAHISHRLIEVWFTNKIKRSFQKTYKSKPTDINTRVS
jgi:peptidoglycan/LPS O-acetylase OafA/YrhL